MSFGYEPGPSSRICIGVFIIFFALITHTLNNIHEWSYSTYKTIYVIWSIMFILGGLTYIIESLGMRSVIWDVIALFLCIDVVLIQTTHYWLWKYYAERPYQIISLFAFAIGVITSILTLINISKKISSGGHLTF